MMNRKIKNLSKGLLLLVGIGLSGLVVLEASQQMVKALDLNGAIPAIVNSQPGSSPTASEKVVSSSGLAASTRSEAVLDFKAQQPVALSTGTANDPRQPVSQASADQIAAVSNSWNGASFPVENFQAYTSPFGYRQSATGGYSQEFHYGLDMAAPEGSYIRNWWSGKVVEVSDDSNCGTSVVVESGSWTHIYCHMEGYVESDRQGRFMLDREGGLQIYEGQQVTAGARIGRVGMTGRTTGPHLHWGLKYDGGWVDPAYVLQAMYTSQ